MSDTRLAKAGTSSPEVVPVPSSALTELREQIRASFHESPEIPKEPLESRVARFTANPGIDYARHAVAYLWTQKGQFPGHYLRTDEVPEAIFSACKHTFRIYYRDGKKVEKLLQQPINDALLDLMFIKNIDQGGGEGEVIEQRPLIPSYDGKILSPLPEHVRVAYKRWYDPQQKKTFNIVDSITGLTIEDFPEREQGFLGGIKSDESISLGDYCDRIRDWVTKQRKRYSESIKPYGVSLLHPGKATSPFESGMGRFFFQTITGEKHASRFRDENESDRGDEEWQINDETIDAIIERILERHGPDNANAGEILWRELPDLATLPRTQKLLQNYVWHRSFALANEHGDQFFEVPSPAVEIDFLADFVSKLGIDTATYQQKIREYLKLPKTSFLSIRDSREKTRQKLPPANDNVSDLYKQTLTIYQMLLGSKIMMTADKRMENKATGTFMQRAAWLLAQKLSTSYVAFETQFFTPEFEQLYALAQLLIHDTRHQMAEALHRTGELADAYKEVEQIAPTSQT